MNEIKKSYIELHIAVLLFGITAILGALIEMPAVSLVWWRVFITSISLLVLFKILPNIRKLSLKMILIYMGIGIIVGLHWLTFYGAIKISSASVTLVSISTASFFTAFLEPILTKKRIDLIEVGVGALIIPGMIIIFNDADTSMINGFIMGLVSAFLAALFSVLNKIYIDGTDNYTITFIELATSMLGIGAYLFISYLMGNEIDFMPPSTRDWIYIIILALLCTTLAYILMLGAMKYLSAFDVNLSVNLEPIYGIILAAVILKEHEHLNTSFYIGATIIILSVLLYPMLKRKLSQ